MQLSDPAICPHCGFDFLHQEKVEVWFRDEDADMALHTICGEGITFFTEDSSLGNPSPRRDGIVVSFFCESCDAKSHLMIYQHKGQTFIEWSNA